MRDATPIQFTLEFSLELATIISPNTFDRQFLRGNVVCNKGQERGRCITLLHELHHLEAGTVVHKNDDVAVPAETRVLHRPSHVDKEPLSLLARPFICHFRHGMTLRLRLQTRLARPPLARRLNSHHFSRLPRYDLTRVR